MTPFEPMDPGQPLGGRKWPAMKPMARASFWLAGPSIAIALLAGLLAIGGGGPGLFFLVLLASGLFLVAMPLLQWGLLALHAFDGRRMAITLAAFLALAAVVVVMGASGLFSFW